jgi:hypothetical protein
MEARAARRVGRRLREASRHRAKCRSPVAADLPSIATVALRFAAPRSTSLRFAKPRQCGATVCTPLILREQAAEEPPRRGLRQRCCGLTRGNDHVERRDGDCAASAHGAMKRVADWLRSTLVGPPEADAAPAGASATAAEQRPVSRLAGADAPPQRASAQSSLAPRTNFLDLLSEDVQRLVANHLPQADTYARVQLSKAFGGAREGSDQSAQLRLQTKMVDAVQRLVDEKSLPWLGGYRETGNLLGHLAPQHRALLVDRAVQPRSVLGDSRVFRPLGGGLAALEPRQRAALVEAALANPDALHRTVAITELCNGMAHFNGAQQAQLVEGVVNLPQRSLDAMEALRGNVAHVNDPALRDRVIDTAINAGAISGLPKAMAHLNADQRERLLNRVFTGHPDNLARNLAEVSAGLAHLSEPQRARVVDAVLGFGGDEHKATAMIGLGPQIAHLNTVQRQRLFDMVDACASQTSKARLIRAFGSGLGSLDERQRSSLVSEALALSDEPQIALEFSNSPRATAIGGLGQGLAHLRQDECERLVDEAVGAGLLSQHVGFGGLCGGIAHLGNAPREKLSQVVQGLNYGVGNTQGNMSLKGLCNSFADLTEREQSLLLSKVHQLEYCSARLEALSWMAISAGKAPSH